MVEYRLAKARVAGSNPVSRFFYFIKAVGFPEGDPAAFDISRNKNFLKEGEREVDEILMSCPLFANMEPDEITGLLKCLGVEKKKFSKNRMVFTAGDEIQSVGILLEGKLQILKEDFWGNRMILAQLEPGELFGEAFVCGRIKELPVTILAADDSRILLLDYARVITSCPASCEHHSRLIRNMVQILARKTIEMNRKIEIVTQRTIREKVLAYLSGQALQRGNPFDLPFNRQEMADYLAVDRSALSNELGKLQKEGRIRFQRNHFQIYT